MVVLEVLSELLGELLAGLSGVLAELEDVGEAGDHVLVVVITLGLLKDLDSKSDGVAGLLALGSEVGVEAVNDDVVSVDGQSGPALLVRETTGQLCFLAVLLASTVSGVEPPREQVITKVCSLTQEGVS